MAIISDDARRASLAAGLLASGNDGEVLAAARALIAILAKLGREPASVVADGLAAPKLGMNSPTPADASAGPAQYPYSYARPMRDRAWMAQSSPHVNKWERQFLGDMAKCSDPTPRQASKLKAVLAKAERA